MKKRGCLALLLAAALFLTGGCSARNVTRGQAEGEAYDAVIRVNPSGEDSAVDAAAGDAADGTAGSAQDGAVGDASADGRALDGLAAVLSLMGKSDDQAAGLLGGGAENRTADGAWLIGRNYEAELCGQPVRIYSSYDEGGLVSMVLIELPGSDGDAWRKAISGELDQEAQPAEEESWEAQPAEEEGWEAQNPEDEAGTADGPGEASEDGWEDGPEEEERAWFWLAQGFRLTLYEQGDSLTLDVVWEPEA